MNSASRRASPRRTVLLVAAAAAAALALAEAACRLFPPPLAAAREAERRFLERDPLTPFYRLDAGTWVPARARALPESFPDRRAPGEALVFIVGESVAQRLPSEALQAALAAAGMNARVVNAGMGAYGSRAVRATAEDLLRHHPAALVALAGNNGAGPPVGGLLSALAGVSALARRLEPALRRPAPPSAVEEDLRAVARAARERGLKAVLCALPVNREDPPIGELPLHRPLFRRGWLAFEAGDAAGAQTAWRAYLEDLPRDAFGHYWLAQALRAAGRQEDQAARELDAALEYDVPDRCKPSTNAAVRRAAAQEGAALADLDAAFAREHVGPGAFLDGVHWRRDWQPFAAGVIAAALAPGAPAPPKPPRARPLSADETDDLLRHTLALALQAGEVQPPMLHERLVAGFARLRTGAPMALEAALASRARAAELLRGSEWTRAFAKPGARAWAAALTHAAEADWRLERGRRREAALARLREGLALDPDNALARRLLGVHLLQLGRREEGRAELSLLPSSSREAVLARAFLDEPGL